MPGEIFTYVKSQDSFPPPHTHWVFVLDRHLLNANSPIRGDCSLLFKEEPWDGIVTPLGKQTDRQVRADLKLPKLLLQRVKL